MRQFLAMLGAVVWCTGAGAAAFFAWLTRVVLCEASCHPPAILDAQLVLGFVGLIPAVVLLYATIWQRKRLAIAALVAGIAIYAALGLLNT